MLTACSRLFDAAAILCTIACDNRSRRRPTTLDTPHAQQGPNVNTEELVRLDINLLRIFYRIYLSKSASQAAIALGTTQSGISHSLRRLRQLFGDKLFVRNGLRLSSTPRADQLFPPVERLMLILENEIAILANFTPESVSRKFVLGMGDLSEVKVLPQLLRFMKLQAPDCSLEVRRVPPHRMVQALDDESIELGIGILPSEGGEHLFQQKLFSAEYSVLACKHHPRVSAALTWKQYAEEEHLVGVTASDLNLQKTILEPLGIRRRVRLNVEGFLSIPWLIQKTELLATVPARLSDTLTVAACLNQFPLPPAEKNEYSIQAMWHPRVHNEPGHRWLRESIFKVMNPDYLEGRANF